jgi:hypothetical protein
MNKASPDQTSFTTFKAQVNSRFRVADSPTATVVELELIEAEFAGEVAKDNASEPQYENFSLIFVGAAEDRLTQKTYRFSHDKIGSFDLFIVPIAAERGMIRYQAVFNRLLPAAK